MGGGGRQEQFLDMWCAMSAVKGRNGQQKQQGGAESRFSVAMTWTYLLRNEVTN